MAVAQSTYVVSEKSSSMSSFDADTRVLHLSAILWRFYLSVSILCYFTLVLHYISQGNIVLCNSATSIYHSYSYSYCLYEGVT